MKIAQLVILPCGTSDAVEVEELGESLRGESGFGSTDGCVNACAMKRTVAPTAWVEFGWEFEGGRTFGVASEHTCNQSVRKVRFARRRRSKNRDTLEDNVGCENPVIEKHTFEDNVGCENPVIEKQGKATNGESPIVG